MEQAIKNTPMSTYEENGFCIVKNCLPIATIDSTKHSIAHIIQNQLEQRQLQPKSNSLRDKLQTLFDYDTQLYLNTIRATARVLPLFQLLTHPKIIELTESLGISAPLFQNQPVLHVMAPSLRIPGGYYGLGVHQDWPSMQGSLDTVIIWVPLTTITKNDFPVEVLPGSHLKGLCLGEATETCLEIPKEDYTDADFIPAICQPGDVIVMSSFLFHRSAQQGAADAFRLAASIRYENADEPTFIERGFPTCQERIVHRELITPNFPTRSQVQKIFNKKETP